MNTTQTTPTAIPAIILADAKTALTQLRSKLIQQEEVFLNNSLPDRIKIGLHCLKAHMVFTIKDTGKRGQGRKPNNQVTADVISPQGFEGWLATECPWLKKPTAYKYMTALKGLALNESSTDEEVEEAVRQHLRIGPVTIAGLCAAAVDAVTPRTTPAARIEQSEFEFLKDGLKAFRQEAEQILALKPQLLENPEMHRAACARAYDILFQLTGTNWSPSDEPDELAHVNPDAISL